MDIRPINMYGANTGNNLNLAVEGENKLYTADMFSSEYSIKEAAKNFTSPLRKKRKTKRLNTIDTDFLPDDTIENYTIENDLNFFETKPNPIVKKLKKILNYLFTSIPLINYFYLRNKEEKIQKTVETLNDIIQNADELINASVPYGENGKVYSNIAQNLTKAANVIGKANKEF